jgi:hypothetical protein
MKKQIALLIAFVMAATSVLTAGPLDLEPKATAPPSITDDDHWHFNIGLPGWIAFVSGDIGLHGANSNVDVDFGQLITHVAGITSISAEARKGRFGLYGDLLYMSLSAGIYGDGLVRKSNLTVDSYIADGEVYYRIVECPSGWLDLRAGGRYFNSFSRIELTPASTKIDNAAAAFVTAANEDLRGLLERLLHGAIDSGNRPIPFPPLGEDVKLRILRLIRDARQDPITAQQKITKILKKNLRGGHGLTEWWTDPYLGVAGRYKLGKPFYLTGKVDVGGFGAGSDVSVQAYGGLGCEITRSIYAELGFRYLYEDYDSGGYSYNVSTYGPQITVGVQF